MIHVVETIDQLRELTPLFDEGMRAIAEKQTVETTMIGADIYHNALSGKIDVARIIDEGEVWGWASWYVTEAPDRTLNLEASMTYLRPGAPRYLVDALAGFLEDRAVAASANRVTFTTCRQAWARRLAPLGFEVTGLILNKEIGR